MTPRGPGPGPEAFEALMAEVMAHAERFGHREHVHLTWLAVRRHGVPAAVGLVSEGIRTTARYAGAPQKYHATMSRAWVELVGHHAAEPDGEKADGEEGDGEKDGEEEGDDFSAFVEKHPSLLDKRLLTRFYRPATLAEPRARAGWVEPDRAPFPWQPPAR